MSKTHPVEEPRLGSWRIKRSLAYLMYAALALAAATALFGTARADLVPPALRAWAPLVFGLFLVLFAGYRFALVRAGRYPAGKAFYQVGAGVLFLTLLAPGAAREFGAQRRGLESLMADGDAQVRALACEVARYRADGRRYASGLVERLDDPSPAVREQALASLKALAGPETPAEAEGAALRWKDWASRQPAP